ncbi:MAG: glycoside hydrolase family 55 protein, partial [Planctomycetota bacterium]|nr:glycoside hydrolase family 55 protein [Planctomycetota bacterium]
EWWMRWMVGGQWQKLPKFFKNQLVERWNSFLKVKYGSDTALRAAWKGLLPGEKLSDASIVLAPMAGKTNTQLSINDSNPHALAALEGLKQEYTRADFDPSRGADVLEFFLYLQLQHKRREAAALKSWGKSTRLSPLIYDTGIGYEIHSQYIHQSADAVAHDAYVNGWGMEPRSDPDDAPNEHEKRRLIQAAERMGANSGRWNNWLLKPPGISQGVPWLEHNRVEGKPFLCYETQIQQPAMYRSDFPLRLLALASIQDWDVICWHYWGSAPDPTSERAWERPMDVTTGGHPQGYHFTWDEVQSAMMRAAGHMFREGAYKPAPNPTKFIYGSKSLYDPAAMDYGGSYGRKGFDMLYTTYQYGVRVQIDPTQQEDKVIGPVVSYDDRHKHNPYTPTDEIEFDWKKGIVSMDAPSGAAFAGLMANVGESIEFKNGVKLSAVKIHNPEGIYDPVGDEKYISFALYTKDGKSLRDTESAALSLVSTSFNTGFKMWAEKPEHRNTPEGRPQKGTLPVLVARVSGTVEAPMLSGMKYTLLDWHMDKVGEGLVVDGEIRVPADKPVFVIEIESVGYSERLEREQDSELAWNSEYRFPTNAGIVNVKDHGAKGDGTTDDTAALRMAIKHAIEKSNRYASPKFIYLPKGIYLVSGPLESRVAPDGWSGGWRAGMLLVGESREHSIIRLKDNSEGYGDAEKPKWVIATGSESDKRTKAGDKPLSGGGNRAFRHSVINLTVDVGKGNPGAIGIDYVASNRGTIESVNIRSSDPQGIGHTGLALTRNWPGPCLIKDVLIEGFDRGIEASHYQYSVTFENVTLRNQRQVGVLNKQNVLAFRNLTSENAVPVVQSTSEHGSIIIVEGKFTGGDAAATAIESQAELYLRDIEIEGYGKAVSARQKKKPTKELPTKDGKATIEFFTTEGIGMGVEKVEPMRLPIKDTPTFWTNDHSKWVCPQDYLESPDQKPADWSDALQSAMNSGKPVVYLPNGSYPISRTLEVPPHVRLIVGFQSAITVGKENKDKIDPAIRFVGGGGTSTAIEHIWVTGHVEHDAGRAVAFRHCDLHGRYQNTKRGTGDFFIEDTIGPKPFLISHPQDVWCRQLNIEFGEEPLIENHGGNL